MKRPLRFAATTACSMLATVTPAPAGCWNYGCEGSVGDTAYIFDRSHGMHPVYADGAVTPYAPTSVFAGSTACTTRPRARASITPTARSASSVTV
jgi:hypothetical protein